MVPGLEERLMSSSEEEVVFIADMVSANRSRRRSHSRPPTQVKKGASSARSDDTKSLKSAILDWITPRGQALIPALSRNVKIDRGYNHERTGALLCPAGMDWSNTEYAHPPMRCIIPNCRPRVREKLRNGELIVSGDQWPVFLYHGYNFNKDDPWNGLFRSALLVTVSTVVRSDQQQVYWSVSNQAFKHIFTSPSSVDQEPKATRSGNARIHGMTQVTPASVAYVATQVRQIPVLLTQ
jgi:hypothetical protein